MRAAKALGQDISSFFLGQMLPKAKETVLFENKWLENEKSVEHFFRIINSEPKEVPKLKEIITKIKNDANKRHPFKP